MERNIERSKAAGEMEELQTALQFELRPRDEFDPELLLELAYLTVDATGEPFEKIGVQFQERATAFDFLLVAKNQDKVVGYGGYRLLSDETGEVIVLYESAKMLSRNQQGKGYGRQITRQAISLTQPNFVAVRTQNPAEALSVKYATGSQVAPLDIDYEADLELQKTLQTVGAFLGVTDIIDTATGICRGMYGERFGDYQVHNESSQALRVVEKFQQLGVRPENGDAVFIIGKVV